MSNRRILRAVTLVLIVLMIFTGAQTVGLLSEAAKPISDETIVEITDLKTPLTSGKTAGVGEDKIEVTEPEAKPTEPEAKPTEPEEKPTEPEVKPTEPEVKPTEPEVKPTEPEVKPTEPEVKPTEPEAKPTEPEVKPTKPEETEPVSFYHKAIEALAAQLRDETSVAYKYFAKKNDGSSIDSTGNNFAPDVTAALLIAVPELEGLDYSYRLYECGKGKGFDIYWVDCLIGKLQAGTEIENVYHYNTVTGSLVAGKAVVSVKTVEGLKIHFIDGAAFAEGK